MAHVDAFAAKEDAQATTATPLPRVGLRAQPFAGSDIVSLLLLILEDNLCDAANAPARRSLRPRRSITSATALRVTSGERSFKATLSRVASASIRFSRLFSSSKARRFFASETFIPPNRAFYF
ncbi:MAG: hypothetical protein AAF761_04350 [Pseudomonadota bacterium]